MTLKEIHFFFNLKDTKVKEKIQKVLLSSYLKPVLRLDQPPSYFN